MPSELTEKYFRSAYMPHMWCAGCGNGTLTRDIAAAVEQLGLDRDRVCVVSGIGCSSRAVSYLDFCTVHTTHGRALAVATGIKLADPTLTVIVIMGDGDAVAIGGNHLIHACRRNIDLTAVVFNNRIYGMTGGQVSPETPEAAYGTTAPYGNIDGVFDIPRLAAAAGASFTARGSTYHVRQTVDMIRAGIENRGFSLIECLSICPTYYGRKNELGGAVEMLRWQRDHLRFNDASGGEAQTDPLLRLGVFHSERRPEYTELYRGRIMEKAMGEQDRET